jgi:hypothetical protein
MKLLLSKFGMAYGLFLIGKGLFYYLLYYLSFVYYNNLGALIILAADIIYSIANMFNQLLFWGSAVVGTIEGKIEDLVITEGFSYNNNNILNYDDDFCYIKESLLSLLVQCI